MCRSRRELSNACLLAKIGFDTAENEPCKVCRIPYRRNLPVPNRAPERGGPRLHEHEDAAGGPLEVRGVDGRAAADAGLVVPPAEVPVEHLLVGARSAYFENAFWPILADLIFLAMFF